MIEEPYRWVEAIANRREYIETQLAPGSPLVALSCREGILFFTIGQTRQKIFEIYDRIAMGAIGHPGDIERLRMTVIELASTEGFARSAADVSLRRLAHYSLSPVLKAAFEQIYGAPYLARMLFGEVGSTPEDDLILRVDYDGAIATNAGTLAATARSFAVLSGHRQTTEAMEIYLQSEHSPEAPLNRALQIALDTWTAGQLQGDDSAGQKSPTSTQIATARKAHLRGGVEAAILDRKSKLAIRYRQLTTEELQPLAAR
ncbi:MAG: 20S proteasome subunit A/B [Chthoniobacterales bacterium]|nr:20S proteasome subunit A/B [Chthoniobacterales bacterium]